MIRNGLHTISMGQHPSSRASIQTPSEEDLGGSEGQADSVEVHSEVALEGSKISAKFSELEHGEDVEGKVTFSKSYSVLSIAVVDLVPQQTSVALTSRPQSMSPSWKRAKGLPRLSTCSQSSTAGHAPEAA